MSGRPTTPYRRQRVIIRLLKLIVIGKSNRYTTLQELAKECGACERTIRRDLQAMEAVGCKIPLWRMNGSADE